MPCYHPIAAWRAKKVSRESGKRALVFNPGLAYTDMPLQVPCGRCIGCRLEKSRQWAVRCMHEASLYESNCFITCTYRPEDLPPGGSLVPEHWVLFMKRLREKYGPGIRFFHCGEYGDKLERPHHHAILFNHDFRDKVLHSTSKGIKLYTSEELDALWKYGFCSVGEATFESAGYIARYSLKKVPWAYGGEEHYGGRVPEYLTMSRKPGIGHEWIKKFGREVYPSDQVIVNGVACKPPRYYDEVWSKFSSCKKGRKAKRRSLAYVKRERRIAAEANPDGTGSRLIVREAVREAAVTFLERTIE